MTHVCLVSVLPAIDNAQLALFLEKQQELHFLNRTTSVFLHTTAAVPVVVQEKMAVWWPRKALKNFKTVLYTLQDINVLGGWFCLWLKDVMLLVPVTATLCSVSCRWIVLFLQTGASWHLSTASKTLTRHTCFKQSDIKTRKKKNYPFKLNIFLCFDLFKPCGNGGYFLLKAHTDEDKGLHASEKDTWNRSRVRRL